MNKRAKENIEYAKSIGYTLDGFNGRGHYNVIHKNGTVVSIAATPGDLRGDDNVRAELRRGAGIKNDGPKAAKYKRKNLGSGFSMHEAVRDTWTEWDSGNQRDVVASEAERDDRKQTEIEFGLDAAEREIVSLRAKLSEPYQREDFESAYEFDKAGFARSVSERQLERAESRRDYYLSRRSKFEKSRDWPRCDACGYVVDPNLLRLFGYEISDACTECERRSSLGRQYIRVVSGGSGTPR